MTIAARTIIKFAPFAMCLIVLNTLAMAGSVTVSWDPNTESDLSGYNIYYDTQSVGSGSQVVNAGNVTSFTINELQEGVRYYFRVTAYDYSGNESGFSDEVSLVISGGSQNLPELVDAEPNGPTQINLTFSEPLDRTSAENPQNYSISNGVQVLAAVLDDNETVVHLLTTTHQAGVNYTLTVQGVMDKDGNEVRSGSAQNYFIQDSGPDSVPPSLLYAGIVDARTVDVVFNEPVEKASAENPSNFDITGGIVVESAVLLSNQSIVRLTTSDHQDGASYTMSVNNIRDLAGNTIASENTFSYQFDATSAGTPPSLASVKVQGPTQIDVNFSQPLDKTSAETKTNYSINRGVDIIGVVLNENLTTVHLLTSNHQGGSYTLTVSNVQNSSGVEISASSEMDYSYESQPESNVTPVNFTLAQNYPNPFNPETEIRFFLDKKREVKLNVYNQLGQLVQSLVEDEMEAGHHTVVWDGTDERGVDMPSGVYFYSLEVKRNVVKDQLLVDVSMERRVRRMTLLR